MTTTVALIPARGGSVGIRRKNMMAIGGTSLIGWAARCALGATEVSRAVFTSEDPELIEEARNHGLDVPFVRPESLARATTPGIAPVLHAIETLRTRGDRVDTVVLLQPTSPFRTAAQVDAAVALHRSARAPCVVSVCESKPVRWMYHCNGSGQIRPVLTGDAPARRQDAERTVVLNGAIYVADADWLLRTESFLSPDTIAYVMDGTSSVDIDTETDLEHARALYNHGVHGGAEG